MATLQEIRARINQQDTKLQKNQTSASDNSIFPHWNADEGTTTTVRFLPDGNASNTFFWVERQIIKLPFNGVKGDNNVKQIVLQVPCMETWNETCPILTEVRHWYKDESLKEMANRYWKKRSYLFQGFVRQNPLLDDKTPENPIRRFIISPQIFAIIKSSLMDPEMEELPTDYVRGLDFNIKKTSKSNYADYSTSTWARKETALTQAEQDAIEQYGLFNLSEFLPKKPNEAELNIMKEMFEASVDGKPYDLERWGAYFRPYGVDAANSNSVKNESTVSSNPTTTTTTVTSSKSNWNDDEEVESASEPIAVPTASKVSSSDKAQDILQMIRARQNKAS